VVCSAIHQSPYARTTSAGGAPCTHTRTHLLPLPIARPPPTRRGEITVTFPPCRCSKVLGGVAVTSGSARFARGAGGAWTRAAGAAGERAFARRGRRHPMARRAAPRRALAGVLERGFLSRAPSSVRDPVHAGPAAGGPAGGSVRGGGCCGDVRVRRWSVWPASSACHAGSLQELKGGRPGPGRDRRGDSTRPGTGAAAAMGAARGPQRGAQVPRATRVRARGGQRCRRAVSRARWQRPRTRARQRQPG